MSSRDCPCIVVRCQVLEGLGIDSTWLPDITRYPSGDPHWQADVHPRVVYTFLKHLWSDGQRNVALSQMNWLSKHFAGSERGGAHGKSISALTESTADVSAGAEGTGAPGSN